MKQIDRLILRSFIGPLVLTFLLAVFVLLMQFLWKYIDDMVGKGLDFLVIAQLLFYASATFVGSAYVYVPSPFAVTNFVIKSALYVPASHFQL